MSPKVYKLNFTAGLYKTNIMLQEHGLILSNISGCPPQTHFQLHGKRQRKTISITSVLLNSKVWPALDKFTHEIVPHMQDLITPKSKKTIIKINVYTLRLRQKFTIVEDFDDLLENQMHDTHKGIYLPLTVHIYTNLNLKPIIFEMYMRMLRLPINLFKKKRRPAYDDKVVFSGLAELYRQTSIRKRGQK